MTGQLRSTLEDRAADLEPWEVDLTSVVHAGDRRLRRRRTAIVGGATALALALGLGSLAYARRSTSDAPPTADQDAKPLEYAVGSVIHTGDDTIDAGARVVSFVPTHWGFVFSTADHRLHQVRNGEVEPVTTFDGHPSRLADASTPLVTGDDGLLTAWWDGKRIQSWPGYRDGDGMVDAFDKTNSFNAARSWPSADPPRIQAVSDGHLWFWDGQDSWIVEVRPMTTTAGWKDTNPPGSGTVVDATGDRVLVRVAGGMAVTKANLLPWPVAKQDGWNSGGDLAGLNVQVPGPAGGDLAPDGKHWFARGADELTVFDSESGSREDLDDPGFAFAEAYQWRDADTIAAYGLRTAGGRMVSLLTCRVSTGTCTVTASDIGEIGNVALPDGRQLGS